MDTLSISTRTPVDFVWVYWKGGAQSDEIRWSIRSVLYHYPGARITIVGDRPKWFTGRCVEVPRVPRQRYRAFRDSLNKVRTAVDFPDIGDQFVWMMDDVYFLKHVPVEYLEAPIYQSVLDPANLRNWKPSNRWQALKKSTVLAIGDRTLDTATHLPHVVDKQRFNEVWDRFDLGSRTLLWEILYHAGRKQGRGVSRDLFTRMLSRRSFGQLLEIDSRILNNGNGGWSQDLRYFLYSMYPSPTDIESDDVDVLSPDALSSLSMNKRTLAYINEFQVQFA